jgi:hypothetical protein
MRSDTVSKEQTAEEWAKAQLKRDLRNKHNRRIVERIKGVPAQPAMPESDADPRNPNVE